MRDPAIDVEHYDLDLTSDPATQLLDGVATLSVSLKQDASELTLALHALPVTVVLVDGQLVPFSQSPDRLNIQLPEVLPAGAAFQVVIHYGGIPQQVLEPGDSVVSGVADGVGWKTIRRSSYVLNEPDGAMSWFPCNDVPSDKATYTFHVTVPDTLRAVANGQLTSTVSGPGTRTFTYDMDSPMATYLATVHIDRYTQVTLPLRAGLEAMVSIPTMLGANFQKANWQQLPAMLKFMEQQVGPYPFGTFGLIYTQGQDDYALETQALITYPGKALGGGAGGYLHEISHQWFGNSVTPANWQDIWLSEGFATYFEDLWVTRDAASLKQRVLTRLNKAQASRMPAPYVTLRHDLFAPRVYQRGALVLHALRATVGDAAFQRFLRGYYQRFAYKNVSTPDFIRAAAELTGKPSVTLMLQRWIYDAVMPPFPKS
ncbi:M1 family metallopeptidase [Deinococcus arboris]|uniref:M1 family metallopeptidase n=1 Tax=Deinococcus arboris TaxID=2682977 RepID=UPI0018DBB7A4|nr:M1 family metallopeptidase [Deinococcus arboris]